MMTVYVAWMHIHDCVSTAYKGKSHITLPVVIMHGNTNIETSKWSNTTRNVILHVWIDIQNSVA